MRCISHVVRRFEDDISLLGRHISWALSIASINKTSTLAIAEHATVRLQDLWSWRVRQLIVLSAIGGMSTRSGVTLRRGSGLHCRRSPVNELRRIWTPRKEMDAHWEPKWYDPKDASRAADLLSLDNKIEIRNGLGASLAAPELRTVRNLIVHRVPDAWKKYKSSIPRPKYSLLPGEYVFDLDPSTGLTKISAWMLDLKLSLQAACQ